MYLKREEIKELDADWDDGNWDVEGDIGDC